MRDIKIRGIRVDGGGWVYGWLVPRSIIEDPDTLDKYWIATGFEDEIVPVVEGTVGQFVGMEDMDGVDIYEGDIVLLSDDDYEWKSSVGEFGEVDTEDFNSDYDSTLLKWFIQHSFTSIKVISNIHQQEA